MDGRSCRHGAPAMQVTATLTAALTAVVLAGCGARNDYSATERRLPHSVNVDAGPIALRHLRVHLVDGRSPLDGAAVLRGSLLNSGGDDTLLRVTTPAAGSVRVNMLSTGLEWKLTDLRQPLRDGTSVVVTFHFAAQGKVVATVPVTADA